MSAQPQQERPPDLESLRAARGQILAAASRRGLGEVRVFGSVARGEAVETSDVDLLVAPGPHTTLFDLSGFALEVWTAPGSLEAVISGKVGVHGIQEAASR